MTDRIERVRIFRPRLETRGVDASWAQVVLEALRTCKPRVTQLQGRLVRTDEEMEQCEVAEDVFGDCVHAQMFIVSRAAFREIHPDPIGLTLFAALPESILDTVGLLQCHAGAAVHWMPIQDAR